MAFGMAALTGCCQSREANATADDVSRFAHHGDAEQQAARADLDHFITANALSAQYLPLEAGRFIEWRKREWWALRDENAWLMTVEWSKVAALSDEVARYYGYNVKEFPKARGDIMRFFQRADPEWRNLVMDCAIFIEYKDRELIPLRKELHQFYEGCNWEAANTQVDVLQFLEWRTREYQKLVRDGRDFFAAAKIEEEELADGIARFRAAAAVEGARLQVDLSAYWTYETRAMPPRLIDDVYRYTEWRERELARLRDDAVATVRLAGIEQDKLVDDLWRYKRSQLEEVPKLMIEVDRFFQTYEREVHPLTDEVKRFWRTNIATGHLAIQDLRHYFQHTDEEIAGFQLDILRFVNYGSKEWDDLCVHIHRFTTCGYDPAYGDGVLPYSGDYPPLHVMSSPPLEQP